MLGHHWATADHWPWLPLTPRTRGGRLVALSTPSGTGGLKLQPKLEGPPPPMGGGGVHNPPKNSQGRRGGDIFTHIGSWGFMYSHSLSFSMND